VPASVSGYYDSDGQWVGSAASGYYDNNGRWVAGATSGQYDANGRWINGAPRGHRDANNVWIADPQPGYYGSDGRWVQGQAYGYYDARGRWIQTSGYGAGNRDDRDRMDDNGRWDEGRRDIRAREAWLEQRIRNGRQEGSLSRYEARSSLRTLSYIRQRESRMRHYQGRLNQRDESLIQSQLDRLSATVRQQMRT
jgi:hypothetical protein